MSANKTSWIEISSPVRGEPEQGVYSAAYYLSEIAVKGGVKEEDWIAFQRKTRLSDLSEQEQQTGETLRAMVEGSELV